MSKYHTLDSWDAETNAPSHNFIYDFEVFKYYVSDSWEEGCAHDDNGRVQSGSVDALGDAFSDGCAVKVGITGFCSDLADNASLTHEVFCRDRLVLLLPRPEAFHRWVTSSRPSQTQYPAHLSIERMGFRLARRQNERAGRLPAM